MTLPHTKVKALKRLRGRGKDRGGQPPRGDTIWEDILDAERTIFKSMVKCDMLPRRFVLQDLMRCLRQQFIDLGYYGGARHGHARVECVFEEQK